MAYGLRVRDAGGGVILDTSDRITRNAYVGGPTSSGGNSGEQPQLDGKASAEFAVPINGWWNVSAHVVSRAGNVISWTTWTFMSFISPGNCVIFSFLYT